MTNQEQKKIVHTSVGRKLTTATENMLQSLTAYRLEPNILFIAKTMYTDELFAGFEYVYMMCRLNGADI